MRRTVAVLLALAMVGGGFAAGRLTGGGHDAAKTSHQQGAKKASGGDGLVTLSDDALRTIGLQTAPAATETVVHRLARSGAVMADPARTAILRPLGQGRVVAVFAQPGDQVRRGQTLLTIDDPAMLGIRQQLAAARGSLLRAVAAATLARQNDLRGQALVGGVVSRAELERRRALAVQADVDRVAGHAAVAALGAQLASYDPVDGGRLSAIRAPSDGVLLTFGAGVGDLVDPARALGEVADLSRVWLEVSVFQPEVQSIDPDGMAFVTVPGVTAAPLEVPVANIGQAVDPRSGAIAVRLVLPNPQGALRPGMIANAALPTRARATGLTVPPAALVTIAGHKDVFVRLDAHRFRRTAVTTGVETPHLVEVTKGLHAGEQVVTTGSFALKSQSMQAELGAGD